MNPELILKQVEEYINSVKDKNSQEFINWLDKLNELSVMY